MTSEAELRASISAVGQLVPLLIWHGVTIDGRRREPILEALGIAPAVRVLSTLEQACTALWPLHPERALTLAREQAGGHAGLPPTVRELAGLCNVSVSAIALALAPRARRQEKRAPRRTVNGRNTPIKFWCEPQFKHYVRVAGALDGLDLSSVIRVACWEYVQRKLPRAPTEGSSRGPSPEWVKKPERRGPRS